MKMSVGKTEKLRSLTPIKITSRFCNKKEGKVCKHLQYNEH